jgi:hypothetical protein
MSLEITVERHVSTRHWVIFRLLKLKATILLFTYAQRDGTSESKKFPIPSRSYASYLPTYGHCVRQLTLAIVCCLELMDLPWRVEGSREISCDRRWTRKDSEPEAVQTRVWGDTGLLNFTQRVTLHILCLLIHYLTSGFVCCAVV